MTYHEPAHEVLPFGTSVIVHDFLGDVFTCQVIGARTDPVGGHLMYELGTVRWRRGWLRRWPKVTHLEHEIRADRVRALTSPTSGVRMVHDDEG